MGNASGQGRKRKPSKIHLLQGTNRPHRINPSEPEIEPAMLEPPAHIKGAALIELNRIIPLLFANGIVTALDLYPIACYCDAVRTYIEATEALESADGRQRLIALIQKETKDGQKITLKVVKIPLISIRNEAMVIIRSFASEYGLTAASRSRVSVKKKESTTGWEKFAGANRNHKH